MITPLVEKIISVWQSDVFPLCFCPTDLVDGKQRRGRQDFGDMEKHNQDYKFRAVIIKIKPTQLLFFFLRVHLNDLKKKKSKWYTYDSIFIPRFDCFVFFHFIRTGGETKGSWSCQTCIC